MGTTVFVVTVVLGASGRIIQVIVSYSIFPAVREQIRFMLLSVVDTNFLEMTNVVINSTIFLIDVLLVGLSLTPGTILSMVFVTTDFPVRTMVVQSIIIVNRVSTEVYPTSFLTSCFVISVPSCA